jgi:hypothetical protein
VNGTRTPITPLDQVERFWSKVDRSGGREACWPWLASRNADNGYGIFHPSRTSGYPRTVSAHRFAAHLAGVIDIHDPTQHVDHTCHNNTDCPPGPCEHRICCNPAHHDRTSLSENVNRSHNSNARKTHCPRGHEYTAENIRTQVRDSTTIRKCRACERLRFVPKPSRVREIDAASVVAAYKAGAGATAISAELHVSLDRIRRVLDQAGIQRRGVGRVPNRKEVA